MATSNPNDQNHGTVSIRSYTLSQDTHSHAFDQIVVPLRGAMDISFGAQRYSVAVGHCIIIPKGTEHSYGAPEQSRFLVADMNGLPQNARAVAEPCVAISADLIAFCSYADVQLTSTAERTVKDLLYALFWQLLAQQDFARPIDDRIMRAVLLMEEDLAVTHSIDALANAAFLSVSQFKTLFKRNYGLTSTAFLTQQRMERARTLLMNTDYPISVVAMDVGYEDASAFARRFKTHFGQSPRELARAG